MFPNYILVTSTGFVQGEVLVLQWAPSFRQWRHVSLANRLLSYVLLILKRLMTVCVDVL